MCIKKMGLEMTLSREDPDGEYWPMNFCLELSQGKKMMVQCGLSICEGSWSSCLLSSLEGVAEVS